MQLARNFVINIIYSTAQVLSACHQELIFNLLAWGFIRFDREIESVETTMHYPTSLYRGQEFPTTQWRSQGWSNAWVPD